jgi:hypothetical protein
MNAARAIRRLEAAGVAEVLQDEILDRLPTRESHRARERARKNSVIRWVVASFFAQLLGQTSLILITGNMLWGS